MCWYDTREVCDKSHLCKLHFLEPALHRWPPPGWFQFHTWSWESQLWGDVLYGDQGTCKFNINKSVGEGVGGRKEESLLSWLSPCPLTFSHRAGKTLPHLLILSGELKCFITAGRSYWRGGCFLPVFCVKMCLFWNANWARSHFVSFLIPCFSVSCRRD